MPWPRNNSCQRRSDGGRPQRYWQLPRVQAQHASVDDAHHQIRRPPERRPRPTGLDRRAQTDATQLDWQIYRCAGEVCIRCRPNRSVYYPPRHIVWRNLHGALARTSAGRNVDHQRATRCSAGLPQNSCSIARHRSTRRLAQENWRVHGSICNQPRNGQRNTGVDCRLRVDGLRNWRNHGRAKRRSARLRLCSRISIANRCNSDANGRMVCETSISANRPMHHLARSIRW